MREDTWPREPWAGRKMSRRDRAAVVLAYECLRHWREDHNVLVDGAASALEVAGMWDLLDAIDADRPRIPRDWRLLRARLALYLRALLRADAGDFGPRVGIHEWDDAGNGADVYCVRCNIIGAIWVGDPPCTGGRIVPLWQQAASASGSGA